MTAIRRSLGFAEEQKSEKDEQTFLQENVMKSLRETFRPEFINRVDEVIVFHKLGENEIRRIAQILLNEVIDRVMNLGIHLSFTEDAVGLLAEKGMDALYGARPLRRQIQRMVEDALATRLLEGTIRSGQRILCERDADGLIFTVNEE